MDPVSIFTIGLLTAVGGLTGLVALRRGRVLSRLSSLDIDPATRRGRMEDCIVGFSGDLMSARVQPRTALPPHLAIQRNALGASNWKSGDLAFDRAIAIEGEDRWLTATLTASVRQAILDHPPAAGVVVLDGAVHVGVGLFTGAARLESALQGAVRLAQVLTARLDVPAAIATAAKEDPVALVRRRCLRMVIRDYAVYAQDVCLALLDDPEAETRLIAARELGARGVETLRDLMENGSGSVRGLALAAYVRVETTGRAQQALLDMAPGPMDAPTSVAWAEAVREIGDARFEPHLIDMVVFGPARAPAIAAQALGERGTLSTVQALAARAEGRSMTNGQRAALQAAIGTIQAQRGGDGGRLSVIGAEGDGKLSVTDGAGELSVSPEDPDA